MSNDLIYYERRLRRWRPVKYIDVEHKLCHCQVVGVYPDCVYLALFDENGTAVRAFRLRIPLHKLGIDELV